MLRVGVTGGIGSGKSTVARRLAELGAVVVDADAVAREVVEPEQPALAQLADRFGAGVITSDGALDRAALAALAFTDPAALADLNAITGPAIAARVSELRAAVPSGVVSVFDMPLLVERGLWVHEHVSIVVEADVETRVRRLVEQRGLPEHDARHRMANQATDSERRAACDIVLDNSGTPDQLLAAVDQLFAERLAPWNDNLVHARSRRQGTPQLSVYDKGEAAGARAVAKLAAALAHEPVTEVSHVGSTAVSGLPASDVIDLQVGVRQLGDADTTTFTTALRKAGYLEGDGAEPHPEEWAVRLYDGTDPAQFMQVHVRETGSDGWRLTLLMRDWLTHHPAERDRHASASEPWTAQAFAKANAWAAETGWTPR